MCLNLTGIAALNVTRYDHSSKHGFVFCCIQGMQYERACPSPHALLPWALPSYHRPEIFGLHENADITCDMNETYDMFATVLSLQPRQASGGGQRQEEVRE